MIQKKSAVDLTELAIGIIILGIVVSVGATVLLNYRDSRLTSLPTYSVTNESTTATTAGVDLSTTWFKQIDSVANGTIGPVISSGNYTVTTDAGSS